MAKATIPEGIITPTINVSTLSMDTASITDAMVKTGNANVLNVDKMKHEFRVTYSADDLTTEIAADVAKMGLLAQFTGEITGIRVIAKTAPTGGDKDVDFDVLKNGSTSVLSSAINYSSSQSDGDVVEGTLKTDGTEDFVADDYYTFTLTRGGSTGTNLKGWLIEIKYRQNPASS